MGDWKENKMLPRYNLIFFTDMMMTFLSWGYKIQNMMEEELLWKKWAKNIYFETQKKEEKKFCDRWYLSTILVLWNQNKIFIVYCFNENWSSAEEMENIHILRLNSIFCRSKSVWVVFCHVCASHTKTFLGKFCWRRISTHAFPFFL